MRSAGVALLALLGNAGATTPPPLVYCCHSEGGCVASAGCTLTKAACDAGCNKPPTPAPPPPTPPPHTGPPAPTPPPGPTPPPAKVYLCDKATKTCGEVPPGTPGAMGKIPCDAACAEVPTPPPASVVACDTSDGSCQPATPGSPGSESGETCHKTCKMVPTPAPATPRPPPPPPTFSCDKAIGKCWANPSGTPGPSEGDCNKNCTYVPPPPVPTPPPAPKTPAPVNPTPPPPTSPPVPNTPSPPSPKVYMCNTTSFKCEEVPGGTPGSASKYVCDQGCTKNAPPTPKPTPPPVYLCNQTAIKCDKVAGGTPGSSSKLTCDEQCKATPPPTPAPPAPTPQPHAPRHCDKHLDLLFVLDGSGSIKQDSWRIDLDATGVIAGSFAFGCSNDTYQALVQAGIVQFGNDVTVEQPFTCDKDTFFGTLQGLVQKKGYTYTGDALEVAVQQFAAVPKDDARVAVVITDGVPCQPASVATCDRATDPVPDQEQAAKAKAQAASLKGDGVEVMTIAVGNFEGEGLQFIKDISSTPSSKYVYNPTDWDKLPALIAQIVANLCPPPSA